MRTLSTVLLTAFVLVLAGGIAFAADGETQDGAEADKGAGFWMPIAAAGLALAVAAGLGALGQAKAIAASVESIARQPEAQARIFVAMIIGLALIETLVIYTLVIAFMMIGKV